MSAFDLWTHQFCLACDKQVQTDGAAYCSETCRLADYEKTSTTSSQPSSPGFATPYSWGVAAPQEAPTRSAPAKFYLSPAYDFSDAQPYGTTPPPQKNYFGQYSMSAAGHSNAPAPPSNLTPSSSHSSLCSMRSTSSNGDASQLSDKARKELRAYAVSFEQVRLQRRRSY